MSFPRYPKYKGSGVEWLGKVPEHWEVIRLKHHLHLLTEKTDRRSNLVALENIEGWTGRFVPTESEFQGEGVTFENGDILFGKLRPYLAKAYLAESSGEAVGDFHVMRPASGIDGRFAQYQILSPAFIDILDGSTFGAKMPRASWDSMAGMPMTTPPVKEQTTIAAFLDRETAKIDELVAEQRQLMELLKEKRQAVISAAVTGRFLMVNSELRMVNGKLTLHDLDTPVMAQPNNQGHYQTPEGRPAILHNNRIALPHPDLTPSQFKILKSKHSGIEWLGDVPEHWKKSKPKHFTTKIVDGVHFKPTYVDKGIPFVTVKNLTAGLGISFDDLNYVTEEDHKEYYKRANPEKGDVLLTKDGTLGVARVVDTDRIFSIFVSVALLKPVKELIDPWFLSYALESTVVFQQFKAGELGSALKHIHLIDLRNVSVTLPPLKEQQEIARTLDREIEKLELLVAEAQLAIDLLQERRTALISAAVTGQIDVLDSVDHKEAI